MKRPGRFVTIFLATGAYSGYAPVMPGTFGTLAAIPVFVVFSFLDLAAYFAATAIFILASIWISHRAALIFRKKDPGEIVIDEVAGFLVTMTAIPLDWRWLLAGFVLFRIFDILKPWPACWADRQLQGGLGIVMDDVFAGIYANLVLQLAMWYF